jgi:hypothetical protein
MICRWNMSEYLVRSFSGAKSVDKSIIDTDERLNTYISAEFCSDKYFRPSAASRLPYVQRMNLRYPALSRILYPIITVLFMSLSGRKPKQRLPEPKQSESSHSSAEKTSHRRRNTNLTFR